MPVQLHRGAVSARSLAIPLRELGDAAATGTNPNPYLPRGRLPDLPREILRTGLRQTENSGKETGACEKPAKPRETATLPLPSPWRISVNVPARAMEVCDSALQACHTPAPPGSLAGDPGILTAWTPLPRSIAGQLHLGIYHPHKFCQPY